MLNFLKRAIDGADTGVSEKRLIALGAALFGFLVVLSVVVLCFAVALDGTPDVNGIGAIKMLLYALVILLVFVLLMSGVITWGDLNTTAGIVRGAPGTQTVDRSLTADVKETTTTSIQ